METAKLSCITELYIGHVDTIKAGENGEKSVKTEEMEK